MANDILDLVPRIKRKAALECAHDAVLVSDNEASIECESCGAALDPWWYLRREANRHEEEQAHRNAEHARFQAWCDKANATMARLNEEIAELTNAKNRLWNERVNGKPLGTQVDRRHDRRVRRGP